MTKARSRPESRHSAMVSAKRAAVDGLAAFVEDDDDGAGGQHGGEAFGLAGLSGGGLPRGAFGEFAKVEGEAKLAAGLFGAVEIAVEQARAPARP